MFLDLGVLESPGLSRSGVLLLQSNASNSGALSSHLSASKKFYNALTIKGKSLLDQWAKKIRCEKELPGWEAFAILVES